MDRREFLRLSALGMGTLTIPVLGTPRSALGATTPVPAGDQKTLADAALNVARARGASYADVRSMEFAYEQPGAVVVARVPGWYRVQLADGRHGWCAGRQCRENQH